VEYTSLANFRERAGYEIEGVWYPRVTSIISIKAKPGLYRYYAGMPNFQAADDAKERSAQEGTRVHDAVQALLRGHEPVMDEITRPAADAYMEFARNIHVRPMAIEERVVSRAHRYAGTVDVIAEIDGVVGVLDIKTSKAIYPDYGLQTAAYVQALSEDHAPYRPTTSWILRLDQCRVCALCGGTLRTKGGAIRVRGGRGCPRHQWGPFLAAKTLWEWEHRDLLRRIETSLS
jgi:hypothetical protein